MKRIGLATAFLLAAAAANAQTGDTAAGEAVYVSDCVSCHAAAARIVRKIEGTTAEEKTAWLEAFLPTHHLASEASRTDLIAYLLSL